MRRSTIFIALLTCIIGAGLFQLKYEVMRLESQYKNICHSIKNSEQSISILKAEWAHLTNPQRLQQLAQKHLGIHPLTQKQVVSFRRVGIGALPMEIRSTGSYAMGGGFQSTSHVTTTEIYGEPEPIIAVESHPSSLRSAAVIKESDANELDRLLDEVHERPLTGLSLKKPAVKAKKIVKVDNDTMDSLLSELAQEGEDGQKSSGRKRLKG